jgi:putative addiction module component (TIGR02574 family)
MSALTQIRVMTSKALLEEILRLPVNERLQLVEEVWDSIAASPEDVSIPEWHKAEIDRRLDDPSSEPPLSDEELRARLRRLE